MSDQLFYDPSLGRDSKELVFTAEESKHIARVLRKKTGDVVQVTNGDGLLFSATLSVANPDQCLATITRIDKKILPMHWLHIAVAPTKNADRFEWFLEKATEIGVNEISPIICEHSERKTIKKDRCIRILESAMKQSKRAYLPKFNEPGTLKEFLDHEHPGLRFIAHCHEGEKLELKRRVAPDKDITILIGPEGDFSEAEVDLAYEKGFYPVSLGEARLRTETAAVVACATVNLINTR
ncbi:MAG: 16S rRNA (uracil(1498)-N(3))-methyltransferase [Flavobacteriaceae bacterium]|nr:16S rRNA (uracil(1498)-N(3))-methyltransferase [Flavobacteriaceae bacterium]